MFHGVDERVPVDGLKFGARVLDRFIDALLSPSVEPEFACLYAPHRKG